MKATFHPRIEAGRIKNGHYASRPGEPFGAFEVIGPCGRYLLIIVSNGDPELDNWEHVSVSIAGKHPPNWQEMSWVKDHFWNEDETVLQFHPRRQDYVNLHPNCLHLWRKVGVDHTLPPTVFLTMQFTDEEKLSALRREISLRRNVYPKEVAKGELTQVEAARQINVFEEIASEYRARIMDDLFADKGKTK